MPQAAVTGVDSDAAEHILERIRSAEGHAAPFSHWRIAGILPETLARALAALPYAPHDLGGVSGKRELHNAHRHYLAGRALADHGAAREVAAAFQSAPVAAALGALAGVVLAGSFLRLEYALDVDGFWLEPHTDLGVKLLTLFVQFAAAGQEGLGTDLYEGPGARAQRTPFGWNAALLFAPSDRSWHGFEPRRIAGVRRSLIVNYVTDAWRERSQLAFPDRAVAAA